MTAAHSPTPGGAPSVSGGAVREFGLRLDWVDAATVKIQPGQCIADDASAIEVASAFTVTFASIDTGSEASSTGYWVWLTGPTSAVLSLSETAPTGVSAGKFLVGWVYNDSSSDLVAFRTHVEGANLRLFWNKQVQVLSEAGTQPVVYTVVDLSVGGAGGSAGALPDSAKVLAAELMGVAWSSSGNSGLYLSVDGVETSAYVGYGFVSQVNVQDTWLVPTHGADVYYKRDSSSGANQTVVNCRGFMLDRSGVTYG